MTSTKRHRQDRASTERCPARAILVTGGAGFIGSRVVDRLIARGESVTVLDALLEQVHQSRPWRPPPGVRFLRGDIRDPETVRQGLDKVDRIVHLAAETGVGQSAYEIARYVDVNERGTALLLEQAAGLSSPLEKIVLASSRAVYGEGRYRCEQHATFYPVRRPAADLAAGRWDPRCPQCGAVGQPLAAREDQAPLPTSIYAKTKLGQEQLLDCFASAYGVGADILRLQNVYGPGQALGNPYTGLLSIFATRLLSGQPLELYEDGLATRDFVFVDDVVDAIVRATLTPTHTRQVRVFNVGAGRAHTIAETAALLSRTLGAPYAPRCSGRYRIGDIRHAFADSRLAGDALGCASPTPLEAGLPHFARWVQDHASVGDRYQEMAQEMVSRGVLRSAL